MFRVISRQMATTEPYKWLPVTADEAITQGEALVLASGKLTKCGATTKPTHIAVADIAANSGDAPVIVVLPDMEFAVDATATVAATLIGTAVTLHTDALSVTATATSGVFTITATDGAKAVRGRFI